MKTSQLFVKKFSYNSTGHVLTLLKIVVTKDSPKHIAFLRIFCIYWKLSMRCCWEQREDQAVYSRSPPLRSSQITLGKFANYSSKESRIILLKSQSFQFLLMIDELDPASLLLKDKAVLKFYSRWTVQLFCILFFLSDPDLTKILQEKKKERGTRCFCRVVVP